MKIGLDVRYISHGLTGGVRTYVYYLARELPLAAPQHQFFFYADKKAPFELSDLPANVTLRTLPWGGPLSSVWNDARLGQWMDRDNADLVHCPGNYGPRVKAPLVVTLHDALNLFPMSEHLRGFGRRPKQVAMMWYLGRMTRSSLCRTHHLITDSDHARRDISSRTGYPLDRITVIHAAATEDFARLENASELEDVRSRFKLGQRFILADGIKNPAAVLDAHRRLPTGLQESTQVVFFSREATPRPAVAEALGRSDVRFIPQPPTRDLVALMNLATVFVFPSWYEGFGIPLVEAMRCGTPIVASSRTSIPEIVGDAGLIFDLDIEGQCAEQVLRILESDSVREDFRQRASKRAQAFSWRQLAAKTIDVYEQVRVGALRLRRGLQGPQKTSCKQTIETEVAE